MDAKEPYQPPRHAVTVDLVIFTIAENDLRVLLIRRGEPPFEDMWALPGGFVRPEESLEEAARRELSEETGVKDIYLEQLYTFGDPHRDPRTRVITVSYYALIRAQGQILRATTDAREAAWHSAHVLPSLAFDHRQILEYAATRLRAKLEYTTVGFQLLPEEFTLGELQRLYEIILRRPLDKRNFRKKVFSLGIVESVQRTRRLGAHRPAQLYRFALRRYETLKERGIAFPF
jgi:ADP-ribose pyrophosphatase YjhB (NUDIX family)